MSEVIRVEVACALPARQALVALEVPPGTTVRRAIELSGLPERFPEVLVDEGRVGIFGRVCPLATVLRAGDRVELYRELVADPKESRRRRAERG